MLEETQAVELPDHVVADVERRLAYTEFDSVDEYVAFALEQLLREVEQRDGDVRPVDADEVKEQLESLGYLPD